MERTIPSVENAQPIDVNGKSIGGADSLAENGSSVAGRCSAVQQVEQPAGGDPDGHRQQHCQGDATNRGALLFQDDGARGAAGVWGGLNVRPLGSDLG